MFKTLHKLFVTYIFFICAMLDGCDLGQTAVQPVVINGLTMGTSYTVKLNGNRSKINAEEIETTIKAILDRINNEMSTYLPESNLSRINQARTTAWQEITPDLLDVIDAALKVSILSNGAFDITVGPIVNLWGFGPDAQPETIPEQDVIQQAMQKTGFQLIQLHSSPPSLKKENPDLYIDLSGIAKGYAVDKIADYLETNHIENYMVEIGGEIRAKGHNSNNNTWRIGIEKPVTGEREVQQVIKLKDVSMATSGDYRNYYEQDGIRYSHTIDPATGYPVMHDLASVTVLHKSATLADALATALLVLGPEKAYALAIRENLDTYFIIRKEKKYEVRFTPGFEEYLIQ